MHIIVNSTLLFMINLGSYSHQEDMPGHTLLDLLIFIIKFLSDCNCGLSVKHFGQHLFFCSVN